MLQNTMELRHSCLIVVTQETASPVRRATGRMQNVMELNIITTFMFDSRGAGNLQSIAQSNRWDAKRNGT